MGNICGTPKCKCNGCLTGLECENKAGARQALQHKAEKIKMQQAVKLKQLKMAKELDPNYIAPDDGYVHDDTVMLQEAVALHQKQGHGGQIIEKQPKTMSKQEYQLKQKQKMILEQLKGRKDQEGQDGSWFKTMNEYAQGATDIGKYQVLFVHEKQADIESDITKFVSAINEFEFIDALRMVSVDESFKSKLDTQMVDKSGLIVICSNFIVESVIKNIQDLKKNAKRAASIIVYKSDGVFTVELNDDDLVKAVEEDFQGIATSLTEIVRDMERQRENSKAAGNQKMEIEDNVGHQQEAEDRAVNLEA